MSPRPIRSQLFITSKHSAIPTIVYKASILKSFHVTFTKLPKSQVCILETPALLNTVTIEDNAFNIEFTHTPASIILTGENPLSSPIK